MSSVGASRSRPPFRRRAPPPGRRRTPRVGLWVTRITVRSRSSTASRSTSRSSRPLRRSRLPVGSSASNSRSAPPVSVCGDASPFPPRQLDGAGEAGVPRWSRADHFLDPIRGRVVCPAMADGNAMLCAMFRPGWRLKPWKMTPTRSRRTSVRIRRFDAPSSTSPRYISPEVRRSRPARQCNSVDFPDPEGPITAVSRPAEVEGDAVERAHFPGAVS